MYKRLPFTHDKNIKQWLLEGEYTWEQFGGQQSIIAGFTGTFEKTRGTNICIKDHVLFQVITQFWCKARLYHVSCVTCHMSCVTCHMSQLFFCLKDLNVHITKVFFSSQKRIFTNKLCVLSRSPSAALDNCWPL